MAGAIGTAASAAPGAWQQSRQTYTLPAVQIQGADGRLQPLARVLDDGRPTVLTFMYSSCTTVCPITNQTLVELEQLLGAERLRVNTVSVTIDPTYDSVEKLRDYARRTGARGGYYTSDPATSETVQRTFNVWRGGDKMSHPPVFLLRAHGSDPWVRIDGLPSARDLLGVYRRLVTADSKNRIER